MSVKSPTTGVEVIAYLEAMSRGGLLHNSRTADGIMIGSLSVAFMESMSTCESSVIENQNINIFCNDIEIGERVFHSKGCLACLTQIQYILDQRLELIKDSGLESEIIDEKIKQTIGMETGPDDTNQYEYGICKYSCQQCVLENVNQTIDITLNSNFDQHCNMPDFQNAFAKGLTSQLTQEFQQQDTLSTTLNTTNENMTRLLVEMMTSDIGVQSFLTNVYQGLLTSQNITIGKESTSLYIRDMSQTINFSQVFSVMTQQYSSVRASLSDKTSTVDVTEINRINQEYFENLVEEIKDITVNSGIDLIYVLIGF